MTQYVHLCVLVAPPLLCAAFPPAAGLSEPTPECRRTLNTWLAKCVFGGALPQSGGTEPPSTDKFDPATALKQPTPECRRVLRDWLSGCVFAPPE